MKTVAIVQARMASTRLPGKVLVDIAGKPLLAWLIQRVNSTSGIDQVVVATTDTSVDDVLADWITRVARTACFRGDEDDVLARFYDCAKLYAADLVVRVTADDPLKDPAIIQRAIDEFRRIPSLDYCSNTIDPTYPEGLDIEVLRFSALEKAHVEATLRSDKEHVTPYIWRQPEIFQILNFCYHRDLSSWRWTVDTPADLNLMRAIFTKFRERPLVAFEEVVAFLEDNPQLTSMNQGIQRNQRYRQSVREEAE